jgi:hypothetical protein
MFKKKDLDFRLEGKMREDGQGRMREEEEQAKEDAL